MDQFSVMMHTFMANMAQHGSQPISRKGVGKYTDRIGIGGPDEMDVGGAN